ncbi:MAG TPA: LLM class flavin-dependent oxidoreductase, partial [Ktedonobacteraceae bacterium]|nr:LLM class flavin-dependent oxidoreductase [Ktedonobacteraceae bacterium]
MARLEEGLEVITRLLHSEEPVTYEGRFFQLRGAALLPHPGRSGGPPILIGGNSTNTLRLVARYADLWNANFLTPDTFQKRSATLDQLLRTAGRNPGDVRRSVMLGLFFARDRSELERQLRETPGFTGQSLESFIEALKASEIAIAGTPDMILEQIHAYEQAGAEELMLQWLDLDDMEGLRAFAASVLPHV